MTYKILPLVLCTLLTADMLGAELPVLKVDTLVVPLLSARTCLSTLVQNARGEWCYVGQFMTYKGTTDFEYVRKKLEGSGREYVDFKDKKLRPDAEWVVLNLTTGKFKIFELPGFHSPKTQDPVLAENGRAFFTVDFMHLAYFDPLDESIKPVGQLLEWKPFDNDRCIYAKKLGSDGFFYGTCQSYSGKTALVRLNPDTLEWKSFLDVGANRPKGLTYGYYLGVEPPWAYVSVGQGDWELMAVNIETGEKKLLAERKGDGSRITITQKDKGIVAGLTDGKGAKTELMTCINGTLVPQTTPNPADPAVAPKPYPHVEWKLTKPIAASGLPPELDESRPIQVGVGGKATVWWRPAGSKEDFKGSSFEIKKGEPQPIVYLMPLPDDSLFGAITAYQGYFRYYPKNQKLDVFGTEPTSGPKMTLMNDKVWFFGYPNVSLSVYDPNLPWNLLPRDKPQEGGNPRFIGSFGQRVTEAHIGHTALTGPNGRIYLLGKRERWSTGAGLGYYEPATEKKFGLGTDMKDLHPWGMAILPKLNRLIVSGASLNHKLPDETKPPEKSEGAEKTPSEAKPEVKPPPPAKETAETVQFRIYDLDLKEVERITLKEGLSNTGYIQSIGHDTRFLGRIPSVPMVLYLYDLEKKAIVRWVELDEKITGAFERPQDHTWWVIKGQTLCRLNTDTLDITPIAKLDRPLSYPLWLGNDLYGTDGIGELCKTQLK